jgi:hypothetical protein
MTRAARAQDSVCQWSKVWQSSTEARLELRSTLGKGTTVTITLPLNSRSESVETSSKTATVSAA